MTLTAMMFYTRLVVQSTPELAEQLTAELADAGFNAFIETAEGFDAFADEESFDKAEVQRIFSHYVKEEPALHFAFERMEKENWNQQWEDNVEPVIVERKCYIRPAFHPHDSTYPYEIVITPKMSFGTGHHATTYLMIQAQMDIDHRTKSVIDAGCGTAILSIMASKLGAAQIDSFDIDEWSVINGKENLEINDCHNVRLRQGKISDFDFASGSVDLILANINKNVLFDELPTYARTLKKSGRMILSGFYASEVVEFARELSQMGWRISREYSRDNWAAVVCQRVE